MVSVDRVVVRTMMMTLFDYSPSFGSNRSKCQVQEYLSRFSLATTTYLGNEVHDDDVNKVGLNRGSKV
jgi:hypothetical protein